MFSNIHFELAEERVEQERDATLAVARANLNKAGADECVDCGQTIPQSRRLAYPAAARCIDCQTSIEREVYCR
ncbi:MULTISPECIES: TraR/DksA C4-type zinc finger protein [Rhizobium/Agrobacterium group]|uniref:TraR/DksA C4-type zinc finger protein n=1 Tax=Rhizobium/Agrobacterium group TaxID=227290 RepID=UPI0015721BF7|nr:MULTISPECIES: TraR/DksA C4-type zinc finger protein [Rhizobium/Agrobacterium group]MCF1446641.1 TraR/DksA family transcriptional regulator [Allorhizobium ampelinum]NSZ53488.1 TraR/DksA family transcriptional regulator [Agrobacterium vitis]NTA32247.1 TraR/DksA family transcriptional regulator [Agrobacterium vitis]